MLTAARLPPPRRSSRIDGTAISTCSAAIPRAANCFGYDDALVPKDTPVPTDFFTDLAGLKLLDGSGGDAKLETIAARQSIVRKLYGLVVKEQDKARNVTPIYMKQKGDLEAVASVKIRPPRRTLFVIGPGRMVAG